ncbi:MAG TPA: type II toxin-antitoxin system HicA family toxin [Chloroflexota bacterium]|nr:type II toxin-antitoxin system HicA family toxin [Chloroflexota bacterium]
MPKVRDIIAEVEADGWVLERMRGSHRIFKHPTKRGIVVIPGHPNKDMPPGTEGSIRRQAGLQP